ncbi:MAG: queuosine precursor transporter [Methanobrevibacter sp.]|uniref:queuosine precursor transporter n=1 Tax=Methanobrevibacter sp. TaxID=66852 RepID=UPI0025EA7D6B|nr:queuosine precursor transporter [Methanobrevibacter sp.]MBQ2652483.1 queuosine precursor transporter [Methanobrevibacter sp.]MBQ2666965.1 queuosine precursor transporter [Methanobrevibacter sp.]
MFENLTKTELYAMLTGIFTASLIVSNIIAGKTFDFFSFTLPCGVIIFPIIYIVNDVLAEVYGYEKARKVILLGFLMNLVAVICYNITIMLPAPVFFENSDAFGVVLGSTFRLLVASFVAYLVGSLVNAKMMVVMKKWDDDKLFLRCIVSTLFGEGLDAIIFIFIAFLGTMPFEALILMIVAQALFKTIYEMIVYPLTRYVIGAVKALPDN